MRRPDSGQTTPAPARRPLERARLLEQVGRAGDDLQLASPRGSCASACAVQVDDRDVVAADDQQGRGADARQGRARPGRAGRRARRPRRRASGRSAAATSAAPPPVLAPKKPTAGRRVAGCARQPVGRRRRAARRAGRCRSGGGAVRSSTASSSGVSRSISSVREAALAQSRRPRTGCAGCAGCCRCRGRRGRRRGRASGTVRSPANSTESTAMAIACSSPVTPELLSTGATSSAAQGNAGRGPRSTATRHRGAPGGELDLDLLPHNVGQRDTC